MSSINTFPGSRPEVAPTEEPARSRPKVAPTEDRLSIIIRYFE